MNIRHFSCKSHILQSVEKLVRKVWGGTRKYPKKRVTGHLYCSSRGESISPNIKCTLSHGRMEHSTGTGGLKSLPGKTKPYLKERSWSSVSVLQRDSMMVSPAITIKSS